MIKRTIKFVLPVSFEATDEKALKYAIREFLRDPSYGCMSGDYSWTQKKPKRLEPQSEPKDG